MGTRTIKSALISVYYKDNLDKIISILHDKGVTLYSTGGTQKFIEQLGFPCIPVEDLTGYPSILGGRVKTLHPKIFGGILGRREHAGDIEQMKQYSIPDIDLVIVDLYPFEETVKSGASEEDTIEKIDIGGISLIRAAAKNYQDVLIVSSRHQYQELIDVLTKNGIQTDLETRKKFAVQAFNTSSHYDSAIFNWFSGDQPQSCKISIEGSMSLRYGENPHQKGTFFGNFNEMFDQLHGKEISYNNLLDIDAAVNLINEFSETSCCILKHNNACGAASKSHLVDAWNEALAADPVSAFGGVIIVNKKIDAATALEMDKIFYEVVIAPEYDKEALEIFMKKKNRIILIQKSYELPTNTYRTALNGILGQDRDSKIVTPNELKTVTKIAPTAEQIKDLIFANKLVKQTKSNTIVLAKNKQLLASGVGQTSRVDALRQAIAKAKSFGFDLNGAVMASDAFFPFPDCVEIAHNEGINTVVQPGGSIKDADSIDYCNANGMSMVFTGYRHFKH